MLFLATWELYKTLDTLRYGASPPHPPHYSHLFCSRECDTEAIHGSRTSLPPVLEGLKSCALIHLPPGSRCPGILPAMSPGRRAGNDTTNDAWFEEQAIWTEYPLDHTIVASVVVGRLCSDVSPRIGPLPYYPCHTPPKSRTFWRIRDSPYHIDRGHFLICVPDVWRPEETVKRERSGTSYVSDLTQYKM